MSGRRSASIDRRLIAVFVSIAMAGLALGGWRILSAAPPASSFVTMSATAQRADQVTLAFGGDTMFGDGAQKLIDAQGLEAPLAGVSTTLRHADLAVVNVEAPITEVTAQLDAGAKYQYASPPAAAAALAGIGVDVLQLGNNHTMDRTAVGLADTIDIATAAGLQTVGAGQDLTEASRPLIVEFGTQRVALLSFGENFGKAKRADRHSAGMVVLSADALLRGARTAQRAGADRLIALVHWGDNYADVVEQQRYWAQQFADAGYDAVIGSGSHTLQEVEVIDGMPVAYSIGNFVFGSPGRFAGHGAIGLGAVATLTFDAEGGTLALRCLRTDNAVVDYVPRVCDAEETAIATRIAGGGLRWVGAEGSIRF